MKCYYHNEVDAVGSCKACCKGLCSDCAVDMGGGLACINSCEDIVKEINVLIKANTKAMPVRMRGLFLWPIFYIILGMLFLSAPVLSGNQIKLFDFTTLSGLAFSIAGIVFGIYQWQLKRIS